MEGGGHEHARPWQCRQRGSHFGRKEGPCGDQGAAALHRQQYRALDAVHVLGRHRAEDAEGGVVQPQFLGLGPHVAHQLAPALSVGYRRAGGTGGEHPGDGLIGGNGGHVLLARFRRWRWHAQQRQALGGLVAVADDEGIAGEFGELGGHGGIEGGWHQADAAAEQTSGQTDREMVSVLAVGQIMPTGRKRVGECARVGEEGVAGDGTPAVPGDDTVGRGMGEQRERGHRVDS